MKTYKLHDFCRGWFIGDFNPSVLRTKDFEVGILTHKKGEFWPSHHHKLSTEYNVLLDGHMTIRGHEILKGDVFIIEPNEVADPVFHEDCRVLVIKTPSVPGDKYVTNSV